MGRPVYGVLSQQQGETRPALMPSADGRCCHRLKRLPAFLQAITGTYESVLFPPFLCKRQPPVLLAVCCWLAIGRCAAVPASCAVQAAALAASLAQWPPARAPPRGFRGAPPGQGQRTDSHADTLV